MKISELLPYLLIGGGVYLVYSYFTNPNNSNPLTGTNSVASGAANLWLTLFPLGPAISVNGNVLMPGGQLIPLSNLSVKQDAADNVYVQVSGHVYQLQPSDANGNWPAALVA